MYNFFDLCEENELVSTRHKVKGLRSWNWCLFWKPNNLSVQTAWIEVTFVFRLKRKWKNCSHGLRFNPRSACDGVVIFMNGESRCDWKSLDFSIIWTKYVIGVNQDLGKLFWEGKTRKQRTLHLPWILWGIFGCRIWGISFLWRARCVHGTGQVAYVQLFKFLSICPECSDSSMQKNGSGSKTEI